MPQCPLRILDAAVNERAGTMTSRVDSVVCRDGPPRTDKLPLAGVGEAMKR